VPAGIKAGDEIQIYAGGRGNKRSVIVTAVTDQRIWVRYPGERRDFELALSRIVVSSTQERLF
jgi:hypothetical protein